MLTVERLERAAQSGMIGGYAEVLGHRKVALRLGMDCEAAYTTELFSRISAKHGKKVQPFRLLIEARCRKCFSCKRRRSLFWQARAFTEWQNSPRTVFGTITMSVQEQLHLDDLITLRLAKRRVDFNQLSPVEIFEERVKEFGSEVTKWLKRLRKGDTTHIRPALRYLLIAEVHDSDSTSIEMRGRPHFHVLLHEQTAGALIHGDPLAVILDGEPNGEWVRKFRKNRQGRWEPIACVADDAFIRKNWTLGFTNFQWAQSANSAVYVCKYLSKSLMLRVRSSQHYGREAVVGPMDSLAQYTVGQATQQE